ncbi:MAG TPA: hypothetical protein VG247_13420 [Pseudonocardiaceae bacterium]|jgi:hypothetical protein|nr:hypothetical protein [Pseudonocardiaceae bacterium]
MTSGGFSVQVEDFAAVGPTLSQAGDELTSAVQKQSGALNTAGSFWGTTAHGLDFGKSYQPLAAKVLTLAKMAGIAVQGVGSGLEEMGKEYGVTESQIATSMKHGML